MAKPFDRNKTVMLAFVRYPEDWIGRIIEAYPDGYVGLDSGLTTKERRAAGQVPLMSMTIRAETTESQIIAWLESVYG